MWHFADLPQMWHFADLRFEEPIFFVIYGFVVCGFAIFGPKRFCELKASASLPFLLTNIAYNATIQNCTKRKKYFTTVL